MSYQILCKCDGCGAEFQDRKELLEIPVSEHWRYKDIVIVHTAERTLHFCDADCLREFMIVKLEEVDARRRKS